MKFSYCEFKSFDGHCAVGFRRRQKINWIMSFLEDRGRIRKDFLSVISRTKARL